MQRAALVLAAVLAYVLVMAGVIWLLRWLAPSLIGWLDASLTPAGARAVPVAITAVLALVLYARWLVRRDAAVRRPPSG